MKTLKVWTDGSCLNNGAVGASCGIGVFYSENSTKNTSTRLPEGKQTNIRAELCAILYVLCTNLGSEDITILTDSVYSIKCITEWNERWRLNGWRTSSGKSVEWSNIIKYICLLITSRLEKGGITSFKHVRGHSGEYGNTQADELARKAALSGNILNIINFLEKKCNVPFS